MFRFQSLSLHGWDHWGQIQVPLDRSVVLLSGPNGSGKTTFLDALRQILNAPRLSSRRRLQHYLHRPDSPALLRAVVTNTGEGGRGAPFQRERRTEPEVTLACTLRPGSSGAPEKRFGILPGQASVEELQHYFEGRDWYPPERYSRALESAGVTRSLMKVLALEQGRTHSLFELSPRELFRYVLDKMGDRAILERYQTARRRYQETATELTEQQTGLHRIENQLAEAREEARRLKLWEERRDEVERLRNYLPGAEYQQAFHRRKALEPKVLELETKVREGEAERVRSEERLRELGERDAAARAVVEAAKQGLQESEQRTDALGQDLGRREAEVARLRAVAERVRALPEADLADLEVEEEECARARRGLEGRAETLSAQGERLRGEVASLREGAPVYPDAVRRALKAFEGESLSARVVADLAEAEGARGAAAEAAMGARRFGLVVDAEDAARAEALAREHGFPGPVYSGPRLEAHREVGPVTFSPGAPVWVASLFEEVTLEEDGIFRDLSGTWVAGVEDRVLRGRGLAEELARKEAELREVEARRRELDKALVEAVEASRRAREAVLAERLRREQLRELEGLPAAEEALEQARKLLAEAEAARGQARQRWAEAEEARREVAGELAAVKANAAARARQLEGERESLGRLSAELEEVASTARERRKLLTPETLARAEANDLDPSDQIRALLERREQEFEACGEPPGPEVRPRVELLERNVAEHRRHLLERQGELEAQREEVDECRRKYLELVDHSLRDYRGRVEAVAELAEVDVEMELPRVRDEDRSLDEAAIVVRVGFDGKEPRAIGDPSFSGGQQVIAGLILLMGMAETDGPGFFLLDEPFAHLSLDRVDQVGRFLRATRSQFLITAPTTLDRAQLDPASLVLVLQKKRKGERYAPVPLVAGA